MANTATFRIQDIQFDWQLGETYTVNLDKGLAREVGGNRLLSDTQTSIMSFTVPSTYGTLTNVSPAFDSTDIYWPKINLTYDRTVANNNTGSFYLYKVASPSDTLVTTIAGTDTRVTSSWSTATIDLSANYELFDGGEQYYITSEPKALTDIFNLQVETADSTKVKFTYKVNPSLLNVSPASTSTNMFLPQVKLTYDRPLVELSTSSNYYLYRKDEGSDSLILTLNNSDPRVTTSGTTATINLSQAYDLFDPLKYYYITSDIGTIRDNFLLPTPAIANTSTIAFTYINNPQLQSVSPALGATDIALPSIQLNYDKRLNKGTTGTVNLYKISSPSNELVLSFPTSDARFIANNTTTAIINLTNEKTIFEGSQQYVVTLSNRAARDVTTYLWTDAINEGTVGFTYKPNPSLLSAVPANNSSGVNSPTISINTNRIMEKGTTGNLYLYREKESGDVLKLTIPVSDSRVTTSSTWVKINLTGNDGDFESGRTHYLQNDNRSLLDQYGLPFSLSKNQYKFNYYLRNNPFPITLSSSVNPLNRLSNPVIYTINQSTGTNIGGTVSIKRNGTAISTATWTGTNQLTIPVTPNLLSTASSFSILATWDNASTEAGEKLWASTNSNIITQSVVDGVLSIARSTGTNVVTSSTIFTVSVNTNDPAPATVSLYRGSTLVATANTTGNTVTFNQPITTTGTYTMRSIWMTSYATSATNTASISIVNQYVPTLTVSAPNSYQLANLNRTLRPLPLTTSTLTLPNNPYLDKSQWTGKLRLPTNEVIDVVGSGTTYVSTLSFSLSDVGTTKTINAAYTSTNYWFTSATSNTITMNLPKTQIPYIYVADTSTSKFYFSPVTISADIGEAITTSLISLKEGTTTLATTYQDTAGGIITFPSIMLSTGTHVLSVVVPDDNLLLGGMTTRTVVRTSVNAAFTGITNTILSGTRNQRFNWDVTNDVKIYPELSNSTVDLKIYYWGRLYTLDSNLSPVFQAVGKKDLIISTSSTITSFVDFNRPQIIPPIPNNAYPTTTPGLAIDGYYFELTYTSSDTYLPSFIQNGYVDYRFSTSIVLV